VLIPPVDSDYILAVSIIAKSLGFIIPVSKILAEKDHPSWYRLFAVCRVVSIFITSMTSPFVISRGFFGVRWISLYIRTFKYLE
jgi:hypothetical protein